MLTYLFNRSHQDLTVISLGIVGNTFLYRSGRTFLQYTAPPLTGQEAGRERDVDSNSRKFSEQEGRCSKKEAVDTQRCVAKGHC